MIAVNMEMPDSCVECRFSQGDYWYCYAMPENFCGYVYEDEDDGRPEWCPLIPILESHYENGNLVRLVPYPEYSK